MIITEVEATDVIKGIISSPNESKSVEFKASFPWSSNIDELKTNDKALEVLRAVMALSNGKDTGYIIIGISKNPSDERRYKALGVTQQDLQTYDADVIQRHLRPISKPRPQFEVYNMWADIETERKNFIIFVIQTFKKSPLISANPRGLNNIAKAGIYIRNSQPETKLISEPEEMAALIDLAIDKELNALTPRIQRLVELLNKTRPKIKTTIRSISTKANIKRFEIENIDIKKIK